MTHHRKIYAGWAAFLALLSIIMTLGKPTLMCVIGKTGTRQRTQGVKLSPGYSQDVAPGSVVTYTHTLTNARSITDTWILDVTSSQGWPVALMGGTYPTGTGRLPLLLGAGLTATLEVSLSVPSQIMSGTLNIIYGAVDTITVTATSQTSPTIYASVVDTATVLGQSWQVFLPLITNWPPPPIKLGVDFGRIVTDTELLEYDVPLVREMGASWVRVYVPWLEIEKSPGQYSWEPFDAVFDRLVELGLEPLPIVYGAPEWAADESCGPISDTLAFEGFLEAILERYGPYTNAWEFTNEPDGMYPHPWGPTAGCWGLHPEAYARQLGIFYNKVKMMDPDALVVFGGLAYDNWVQGNVARDFFTNTLRYGAGQFFDVANLHYYPINPVEFPTMAHKVNEIRGIMDRQGVRGKMIWVTETGMWVNLNGSVEMQREFIVRELIRSFGVGVDNIFWFEPREIPVAEGRVHRWLISSNHDPINGYTTFQNLARKLDGVHSAGMYQDTPAGVEAWKFSSAGRSLYVLWSNTVSQTVTISASASATLTNRDGSAFRIVPVQNGRISFEVGHQPVFLEVPH